MVVPSEPPTPKLVTSQRDPALTSYPLLSRTTSSSHPLSMGDQVAIFLDRAKVRSLCPLSSQYQDPDLPPSLIPS